MVLHTWNDRCDVETFAWKSERMERLLACINNIFVDSWVSRTHPMFGLCEMHSLTNVIKPVSAHSQLTFNYVPFRKIHKKCKKQIADFIWLMHFLSWTDHVKITAFDHASSYSYYLNNQYDCLYMHCTKNEVFH